MIRRNRDIEIFSLSALDLFASAMGVFVLLSVMMLPFYFKGKEYEEEIGLLERILSQDAAAADAAASAVAQAAERVDAIEQPQTADLSAAEQTLRAQQQRQRELRQAKTDLEQSLAAAQGALAAAPQARAVEPDKVTFRFLGLKTDAERYLILVDGARRIRERAPNLPAILRNTISVFGPGKQYAIAFYNNQGGRLNYVRWPQAGFARGGRQSFDEADAFMQTQYAAMAGGSATVDALETALREDAEAIIFISDGFILEDFNRDLRWSQVVERVTRANADRVEINAVAIGIAYRNPRLWGFLNELRRANGGDLKMVPP